MSFHERLRQVWRSKNSLVCVGIDPEVAKIPAHLHDEEEPYLAFGTGIVDATAPYVCAFKAQAAHFAAVGAEDQLAKLNEATQCSHSTCCSSLVAHTPNSASSKHCNLGLASPV